MFITMPCKKCGMPVMQRDVEATIQNTPTGVWMIITAFCKVCNFYFTHKFKGE